MSGDELVINSKGEGWGCQPFLIYRQPVSNPSEFATKIAMRTTKQTYEGYKSFFKKKGTVYLESVGHLAACQRFYNPGPVETPWYCQLVKTHGLPYNLVGKAVLTVLYTRFPGSLILPDDSSEDEQVWEWATAALPAHAFVPNLGRGFPKRMWDKVRRYVFTVQPAIRACKLRAAEKVYADGAPEVGALQAAFAQRAADLAGMPTSPYSPA
jgi:hypothetical protein